MQWEAEARERIELGWRGVHKTKGGEGEAARRYFTLFYTRQRFRHLSSTTRVSTGMPQGSIPLSSAGTPDSPQPSPAIMKTPTRRVPRRVPLRPLRRLPPRAVFLSSPPRGLHPCCIPHTLPKRPLFCGQEVLSPLLHPRRPTRSYRTPCPRLLYRGLHYI